MAYTYDTLNRLESFCINNTEVEAYRFASQVRLDSKGVHGYTYGDGDHVHAATAMGNNSYTYDENGNMLTRNVPEGNFTLTHNADNRLVGTSGAASAQFIYNGDGARVVGMVNGVTSIYIGSYYEYQLPHSTHIFSDSFVSGNLWAWSTYPMDTDMQVTAAAALDGDNKGVAVVLAGNDTLILGDDSPNQAANYHARFKFSPNSVSHGTTYQTIFSGKNASGAEVFRLEFRKYGSYYYLRPSYRTDSLTWVNGSAYTLLNAANEIEIYWRAATGAGANNGIYRLWINGTQRLNVTTIDNDTFRLEAAAFQFKDDASSSGTLYLDAFTSWADSSLAHERKYYSAGSGPVAMRVDGVLFYLLGDHLGSTSLTTHANWQVHSEMKYKPYGEMRLVNGQSPTDIGYTGQRAVVGIGLHFYNARHYDSSLGRFVEADSIVPLAVQGVQAWDRYAYVNNSPVNFSDPSGNMLCSPYRPCEPTNNLYNRRANGMIVPSNLPEWGDDQLVEVWIWLLNTDTGRETAQAIRQAKVSLDPERNSAVTMIYEDGTQEIVLAPSTHEAFELRMTDMVGQLAHEGYHWQIPGTDSSLLEEFRAFEFQANTIYELTERGWGVSNGVALSPRGFEPVRPTNGGFSQASAIGGDPTGNLEDLNKWFSDFHSMYLDKELPSGIE